MCRRNKHWILSKRESRNAAPAQHDVVECVVWMGGAGDVGEGGLSMVEEMAKTRVPGGGGRDRAVVVLRKAGGVPYGLSSGTVAESDHLERGPKSEEEMPRVCE